MTDRRNVLNIIPTDVWYEKDIYGTIHVYMQHQGHDPFDFIQINYDYRYTSNGHQHALVKAIGKLIDVEDIPQRNRDYKEDLNNATT